MVPHATHQQTLIRAVLNTTGPILELGAGWFSTPILHELAKHMGRRVITVEHDPAWYLELIHLQTDWHEFVKVEDWDEFIPCGPYGVAFVDHHPAERRAVDIERLIPHVDVFVIHDTEAAHYGYDSIWHKLRNVTTDKRLTPWTTTANGTAN